MKTVFLMGDSIRMGYDRYVRDALAGEAAVYYPSENCRFAQYTLRNAHDWIEKECQPECVDVVHWNAGLWDVARLFGDEPLTPIGQYASLLERIVLRIRKVCPNAAQIFALSTPIVEARYEQSERFMRYNAEIEAYNRAARETMERLGVPVNDLYAAACALPESAWSDPTHLHTPLAPAHPAGHANIGRRRCERHSRLLIKIPKAVARNSRNGLRLSKNPKGEYESGARSVRAVRETARSKPNGDGASPRAVRETGRSKPNEQGSSAFIGSRTQSEAKSAEAKHRAAEDGTVRRCRTTIAN